MTRSDVTELHYITAIANVPSILKHGILSHALAQRIAHESISQQAVQNRRQGTTVPRGRPLHEYVNLYFDAHNPMLSACRSRNNDICVLQVHCCVLDLNNVIVTDQNAAKNMTLFSTVSIGLTKLDRDQLYAVSWLHSDAMEQARHKGVKCAEVLVPDLIEAKYLAGAFVANQIAMNSFQSLNCGLPVKISQDLFFI